jgi:hypothetical protein
MISKKESLIYKRIGRARRSSRRNRGSRETSHHFSEIVLKDNQF